MVATQQLAVTSQVKQAEYIVGYTEAAVSKIELAKAADEAMKFLLSDSPDALTDGLGYIYQYEDYAPDILARIAMTGKAIKASLFDEIFDLNLLHMGAQEEIGGAQLEVALRNGLMALFAFQEQKTWLLKAQEIYMSEVREDWKAAGYEAWYLYAQDVGPSLWKMGRTHANQLKRIFTDLKPRLVELEISLVDLFREVTQTVAEELVPVLTDTTTLDNDGLRWLCERMMAGDFRSGSQVKELKNNIILKNMTKFNEHLREAGLNVVERLSALGLDRLPAVSQFVISGQLPASQLGDFVDEDGTLHPGFLSQMAELPKESVEEICRTPHTRDDSEASEEEGESADGAIADEVGDIDVPAELKEGEPVQMNPAVLQGMVNASYLTPGATDVNVEPVIQVEDVSESGYITGRVVLPMALAAKLQKETGLQFVWNGVQHTVKGMVLVQKKKK